MSSLPGWAIPTLALTSLLAVPFLLPSLSWQQEIQVAFIGNSVQFTYDLPRFMEAISANRITQNSCLSGYATISSMWEGGNGMYGKFSTANALISDTIETSKYIYDYGACSTTQLLDATDQRLAQGGDDLDNGDNNPCVQDQNYLYYALHYYGTDPPEWDFVVMNDATRNPARSTTRQAALESLETYYAPWFNSTESTIPVFISTYAYWTESRDMGGLVDIPTFTSLTHEGYRQYAEVLNEYLPDDCQARIAPVGIAFLLVWEENYGMWLKLFQPDNFHLSPHGTYVMGCVLYHTLYGHMPQASVALPESIFTLFARARRMQPPIHHAMPMPTREEAGYLYNVAERVAGRGHLPKSFIQYSNGEAAEYEEDQDEDTSYYEDEEEYYFDYQDFEGDDHVDNDDDDEQ